jgi:hypothetical protein
MVRAESRQIALLLCFSHRGGAQTSRRAATTLEIRILGGTRGVRTLRGPRAGLGHFPSPYC